MEKGLIYLLVMSICLPGCSNRLIESATPVEKDYHENCGVNVAYLILRILEKQVDLQSVAQGLNAGDTFAQPVSMLQIKNILEQNHIKVFGLQADESDEFILCAQDSFLILHIKPDANPSDIGHYIIVTKLQDHYIMIDPPRMVTSIEKEKLKEILNTNRINNKFLMVAKLAI